MPELGDHARRAAAAAAARRETYGQLGIVEHDVIVPLLGPAVLGATRWPTRPAWRVIRRSGRTAIASDALSDPWDDEYGIGFGLELWIESQVDIPIVVGSWLLAAIQDVSYTVAGHGGVRHLIDDHGPVSIEIAGRPFPKALHNAHGRVGVLIGLPGDASDDADAIPSWLTLPEGRARLVPMTLLTTAELAYVVARGEKGRIEVARRLAASPSGFRSDPSRASVV